MKKPEAEKENPVDAHSHKKLGDILVEAGVIAPADLEKALNAQRNTPKKIGQILMDMGIVDDIQIARALSAQLNIPYLHLPEMQIDPKVISQVSAEIAETYLLLPTKEENDELVVTMANPLEFYALDDLRFMTQKRIKIAVSPQSDVLAAIDKYYPKKGLHFDESPQSEAQIEVIKTTESHEKELDKGALTSIAEDPPVVRFANSILADAVKLKASDIHIEPRQASVIIRYRIDGIMREILKTDKLIHSALVSRIKVFSSMDISIRRKPQDGRAQVKYKGIAYDLRVSSFPTSYGEKITIRILNPESAKMSFENLGLQGKHYQDLEASIHSPQGLILVTGPTGSGKSTTLYACLNRLNSPEVNIITVEDPVEYKVDGINQGQINPKAGITFPAALRSILRQDPDIVMVGEIRDGETAGIACQAAQTGHLVLSTLHTNDTPSAITRLLDLGVDAFVVADSVVACIGQRLVRRICDKCKTTDELSAQFLEKIPGEGNGKEKIQYYKGEGCEACRYSGYVGRVGIYEILRVTPSVQSLIKKDVSAAIIKAQAMKEGFQPFFMDGVHKARQGLTTIGEVLRVASPESLDQETPAPAEARETAETTTVTTGPAFDPTSHVTAVGHPTVLVVDDNEIELEMMSHLLKTQNYRIIKASNGAEALKSVYQAMPDLIVTDYMMPEMDGLTLIKKLKAEIATRMIPVIMLTANEDLKSEVEVLSVGADDYMTKPVNYERFIARVNRLLQRRIESSKR
ncbi:ATPase, T2SS/T4P/T4SS family [Desulfoluna spongiiphila]|uniref:Type IV pilus assembly protein PilB n=1 Tax=Desulfoluna spongiiphila TaxID=419481 RepID=A0A1G5BHI4_9BACT|nr:ATPase, T2SS/T4P/T4SS family [Desulfoluna spongiiphila]SCX89591.1 type IV pilus assembly protein PilB [Desulfoluna spongiiphila]VVS93743.1 type ii/iv secretion system protein [Desulfoluna spongiiphila]